MISYCLYCRINRKKSKAVDYYGSFKCYLKVKLYGNCTILGISIMNELITRNWPCEIVKLPISPPRSISFGIALNYLRHSSPAVKRFVKYSESIIKKKNK